MVAMKGQPVPVPPSKDLSGNQADICTGEVKAITAPTAEVREGPEKVITAAFPLCIEFNSAKLSVGELHTADDWAICIPCAG